MDSKKKKSRVVTDGKRQRKLERQRLLAQSWEVVNKANNIEDPLKPFAAFTKLTSGPYNFRLSSHRGKDFNAKTEEDAFRLLKQNMQLLYKQCDWGWDEKLKRSEMTDKMSRFLVVRDDSDNLVAFAHYRFDVDFDVEVLYLYELQLAEEVRRLGLGKFMLQALELIAFSNKMKKVILTVLKNNPSAIQFFNAMNYTIDETSPEDNLFETHCYFIYSKRNKRLP